MKTFNHLKASERYVIESLHHKHFSVRHIARILDRSPNTISREIKRCKKVYHADKASTHAYYQRYRCKRMCMKIAMNSFLVRFVREQLKEHWSPEMMSNHLKTMGIAVSAKAIYKYIRSRSMGSLLFWGWDKKKTGPKPSKQRSIKDDRKYIDERPPVTSIGHYEMDFIVSRKSTWVLLVLVDRMSKHTFFTKLPNRKHTTVCCAFRKLVHGKTVASITTDNDIAFSCWKRMETIVKAPLYFCHPYHSWEKGLVENTNRWIRCFIPKKRDIGTVTDGELEQIDSFINHRPREVLAWRTAYEVYYQE